MFEFLFKYPRELYAQSDITLASPWPDWLPITLAAIGVAAIVWFLFVRRGAARAWQLVAIGVVQLAMLATLLWVLLMPTLETEQLRSGENSVALVLDNSASMAYGEAGTRLRDGLGLLEGSHG